MLDKTRIELIVRRLAEVWKLVPDWRLSQLVCNVARRSGWTNRDVFYYEDADLFSGLNDLYADLAFGTEKKAKTNE